MEKPKLIFATHNEHKLKEVRAILSAQIPTLDTQQILGAKDFNIPEPVENATDFVGNALIKAQAIVDALGVPALADDSGICVDILGGAPGIFSARWCGKHGDDDANLDLLLAQLADVPAQYRGANFTCAAALVLPSGEQYTQIGKVFGTLRYARAGSGGFGYDPIFQPTGEMRTLGEFSVSEKQQISHRAKAFSPLAPFIAKVLS